LSFLFRKSVKEKAAAKAKVASCMAQVKVRAADVKQRI
jgi:hypothetical protein